MHTYTDLRESYLQFFAARGHVIIPSAHLVPQNDPTTLFTGSGMQPLVPYLLGEKHPKGTRLTDSQKCFRAEDIEEVGDNRHTTFFEMLGNWSLGDYFKSEQLPWFFEFLTDEVGLDPQRLYVTVFDGEPAIGIPRDDEAVEIWRKLFAAKGVDHEFVALGTEKHGGEVGMQGGRIFSYGAKKNWWSRSGTPEKMPEGEIGGPDSEVFYDFGTPHDTAYGAECHPNCDCGRFMEIGNSVFIQYIKKDGAFEQLPQKNVDFGGGLERIAAAKAHTPDVFRVGVLNDVITIIEKDAGVSYAAHERPLRIIADHLRGAVFMLGDGVLPSNTEQGYFVRRLIRRAVHFADTLGLPPGALRPAITCICDAYGPHFEALHVNREVIVDEIEKEEARFRETLKRGMREFEKIATNVAAGDDVSVLPGLQVFTLITTYGFPKELVSEIAGDRGLSILWHEVEDLLATHRSTSRAGAEKRFKGGLADTSEFTTRLHTTHHLLLRSLQMVLGDHVKQRGSNITAERLRIDFSHGEKMTPEQKAEVERIVNEQIAADLPVVTSQMPREKAETLGAEMEFGQKYPDVVTVYSIGPKDATLDNPQFDKAFSIEFCGGPHVKSTGDIGAAGSFRIQKEEASSAGVRRIKATIG